MESKLRCRIMPFRPVVNANCLRQEDHGEPAKSTLDWARPPEVSVTYACQNNAHAKTSVHFNHKRLVFLPKKGAVFLLFVNPDKRFLGYNAQACSLLFSFTHFICGMSNRFARGNIVWECHLKWSFEASGNVFSLRPKVTQFNIIQFDNILFSYKGESVLQICPSDHSKLNTWSNIISYCRKAKLTDENIKSKIWVYLRKLRDLFSSNFKNVSKLWLFLHVNYTIFSLYFPNSKPSEIVSVLLRK